MTETLPSDVSQVPFGHSFRVRGRHASNQSFLMLKKLYGGEGTALVGLCPEGQSIGDARHRVRLPGVGTVDLLADAVIALDLQLPVDIESVRPTALCATLYQLFGRPPMSREMLEATVNRRDDLPCCDSFFSTHFDWEA